MIGARLLRVTGAWMMAVLAAYLAAATFATAAVMLSLHQLGVPLSPGEILFMIGHDWWGMRQVFLPIVAVGFLIAMPVAAGFARWKPAFRVGWFAAAGAAALIVVHLALVFSFGITPVAVARTTPGLVSQALAGAVGGGLFALTLRRRP